MKVTYNWLKDFVDVKLPAEQLAHKLTMAGLEVTCLEEKDGDFVYEIEVTSNRPDWLSVIGLAREVAAITNQKFRIKDYGLRIKTKKSSPFTIEIKSKQDCPLYTGKIIRGVKVGPSPDWLRQRLELVGLRSVNNIVDITNYVLIEYGEPLHAFDLNRLSGDKIIVRRAKKGEKLITIDQEERLLDSDILVIADKNKALAIAGIIGGKESEVTEQTTDILLEAAIFNPIVIRKGRQKLGTQSESSYRFERGVDAQIVEAASSRAAGLIEEISHGRCLAAKGSGLPKKKEKCIKFDLSFASKILGIKLASNKASSILISLGFKMKSKSASALSVVIPSCRQDINIEVDLIEEIARIFGYEQIPTTLPRISPQIYRNQSSDFVSLARSTLLGLGLQEVITYGLIERQLLKIGGLNDGLDTIDILNPLSKEQEILRPTLIPSLIRCISYNFNQKQSYVNIFELSKIFYSSGSDVKEELVLGIALSGERAQLLSQGQIKEKVSILHLKGIAEVLFRRLGIKDYYFNDKDHPWEVGLYIGREKMGRVIILPAEVLESFDIKNKSVVVAQLYFERLFSCSDIDRKVVALSKYPGILRDISIILREGVALDDILNSMKEKGAPLLVDVKIVDYYKGKQIPAGYRGLTISCLYRSQQRTLTEAEINPLHSRISFLLADKFGAQIR